MAFDDKNPIEIPSKSHRKTYEFGLRSADYREFRPTYEKPGAALSALSMV